MKKLFYSLGFSFCLVSGAFATDNTLDLLNAEIKNILAPFQNNNTSAKLKFDAVEFNNTHAEKIALNGLYNKIGSKNIFEFKVDNLSYNYDNGQSPITTFRGSIGLDFTKLLSPEESNRMIPGAIELLEETVKEYTDEYGDAISIKGVITSTTKGSDGNYVGLTALVSTKIDLNKLPEYMRRNSIIVTDAVFSFTLNLKTGIAVDAYVMSNPEYIGFEASQIGLKEILESLIAQDEESKIAIAGMFMYLDYIASDIVEASSSPFLNLLHKKIALQ
ncbi:hypothetical protein ACNVED_04285 [Legionella sp. D16C41]|uniref:hypothetical protein n=1 Tax=Legionella sp. D16C41 TaxID=3402688 RepID=UPI003AF86C83